MLNAIVRPAPITIATRDILVIDLEATCDARGFPRNQRETIEIGAVLVDSETLTPSVEYQAFVRPVRHPTLTDYCVELTSISQDIVDSANGFETVFPDFVNTMVNGRDVLFVSWGGYDRRQLVRDCVYHGVEYPFTDHLDVSKTYTVFAGLKQRASMLKALEHTGLSADGRQHRAIDDARNLARLLPWCLGRQAHA